MGGLAGQLLQGTADDEAAKGPFQGIFGVALCSAARVVI